MATFSNQDSFQRYGSRVSAFAPISWAQVGQQESARDSVRSGLEEFIRARREANSTKVAHSLSPELAPVRAILKLKEYWDLTDEDMARMCGLPAGGASTLQSSLSAIYTLPDIKRRMQALMNMRTRLSGFFRSRQTERAWLRTPWARTDDQTPLAMVTSGDLQALLRIESLVRELVGA
ncbi:MAG: hypothetical protein JSS56_02910 [Proteobacteria bacterium]|nr:hypothetical protein [Pseudomonadota bacterium]